jgi:hypothetical protein
MVQKPNILGKKKKDFKGYGIIKLYKKI